MKARLVAAGTGALLVGCGAWALVACGNDDDANEAHDGGGVDASVDASVAPHADGGAMATDSAAAPDGDAMSATGDAALDGATDAGGPLVAYLGGYGGVITRYAVDESRGILSDASATTSFGPSPSFLAVTSDAKHLYATDESSPGKVGAYSVSSTGALTFLSSVSSGGDGPAYVGLDRSDAYVLVANYTSGTIAILPIGADGTLGAPTDTRSPGMNAHMMIADPSNHFVFVPCLGSDYVAQYVFDATTGKLTPNPKAATFATATKAGPRHLAFHPNGKNVYLLNETGSTLQALLLDPSSGTLTSMQTTSSLGAPNDGADASANTAAEVWVHPSGKWLVASNRGDDSLVVFALDPTTGTMTFTGRTRSGGATPRDFAFSPAGTFLYAANQNGGNVVPFAFDAATGALSPLTAPDAGVIKLTMPSFVGFARLPAP
jgi:6-phosphogluconolactonase